MVDAARQFVRKILLLHAVLLVVVLGIVVLAAQALYGGARDQAILQARLRQEMLAEQTGAAIESYYGSIIDNLDLLRRSSEDSGAQTQPAETQAAATRAAATTRINATETDFGPGRSGPGGPGGPDNGRGFDPGRGPDSGRGGGAPGSGRRGGGGRGNPITQFGGLNPQLVWRQLQGRATVMFTYDRVRGNTLGPSMPDDDHAQAVITEAKEWMKTTTRGGVSPFLKVGAETGHVIAVPSMNGDLVMAAFVPLKNIREQFFDPLNKTGEIRVSLVDQEGIIMAASEPTSIGLNLKTSGDPTARELFDRAIVAREKGSFVVENPPASEFIKKPRIFAFAKIDRPADVRWAVVISSLLSDTEEVVSKIFSRALYWSMFLGLSITALMISTAMLLIRSRLRLERRHEVINRELREAREIQKAWLPEMSRQPAGVEIAAVNLPASQISGDFYNWFSLPDGRVALAIGDVTGHGMAAAFLMATTQLLVRTTMARIHDPGLAMEEINKQLCTQAFRGQFVTMLLMVINPKDGAVEIASAGHPAPLLGVNGVFEPLVMESQLVLGVDGQERYETERFCLEPGAAMLLYTDGVIEAESPDGQAFSARFLVNALTGATHGVDELVKTVVERVKGHARTGEFVDDLTLVAVRRKSE